MNAPPITRAGLIALCALIIALAATPGVLFAQDRGGSGSEPQAIFLEEDKIDVEADLPSVEFVLNFKGLRYDSMNTPTSFLDELYETVERDPF